MPQQAIRPDRAARPAGHMGKQEATNKPNSTKQRSWFGRHWTTLLLVAILFAGLGLLLYPSVADYWNSFHQSRAVMEYTKNVTSMDNAVYDEWIRKAREYNRKISQNGIDWMPTEEALEEYNRQLDFAAGGNMGYIVIDKIGVMLSLFHGTSTQVLQTGVGHLEGTSLPVGTESWNSKEGKVMDPTEGSHCVLSGHRGLPSAKLFTDLDKMVEGDTFSLIVLDETFTYQVDQIRVVEPTDLSSLRVVRGRDYCTLVTCTPYGVNTHRLLVRGHRVANAQGDMRVVADALQIRPIYIVPFLAVPIVILLILLVMINSGIRKRHRKALQRSDEKLIYWEKDSEDKTE